MAMQVITGAVGDGATNAIHDVALVQAMLVKIKGTAAPGRVAAPYLARYDGVCGKGTIDAIRAFQADHVFVSATTRQSVANPNATSGQVKPGDATWTALLAKVPADFASMRVLTNGKTVYVEATATQFQAKVAEVGPLTFAPAFRLKVLNCINQMRSIHGIALGVCAQGDRRTFQAQYALLTNGQGVTHAGPGESNHNYGMATDLGFGGLRWLHADGAVDSNETSWLHHLAAANNSEANRFWDVLRVVGTAVGAFRGPAGDRPHLQNWNDSTVSMTARLAVHLQASGTMRWARLGGVYTCDLGLGGALYPVGTAAQIWNLAATLTVANITQARAAASMQAARGVRPRAATGAPPVGARGAAPALTHADVTAMRQSLRDQFDLADANWQSWTPN